MDWNGWKSLVESGESRRTGLVVLVNGVCLTVIAAVLVAVYSPGSVANDSAAVGASRAGVALPWVILLCGAVATLTAALFACAMSRRVQSSQSLVTARNEELELLTAELEREVTERKRLAKELTAERDQTQAILDALPSIVILKDCENGILRVNQALAEQVGKDRSEIEGRPSREIFPELADKCFADDLEVINSGKSKLDFIEPLEDRWVRTDKVPTFDDAGNVTGIIVIATDVTESQRVAETVRLAFEASPTAMLMVDEHAKVTTANSAALELFGHPEGSLIDLELTQLLPKRFRDGHGAHFTRFMSSPTGRPMGAGLDLWAARADGSEFPVEIALTPIKTSSGRHVVASIIDLTERREAERKLLSTNELLERTGELACVGGWEVYLDPMEIHWSDQVCKIHGESPGFRPELETAINYYVEEYREMVSACVSRCIETGESFEFEAEIVREDGRRVWVHSVGEAKLRDGAVVGLLGTFQDIDEKRRAEIALRTSEERLETTLVNTNVGFWDWNAKTDEAYYSPTWKTQLGYPADAPWNSFSDWRALIHPDDLALAMRAIEAHFGGEADNYEAVFRMRAIDGVYRWIRAIGKAHFAADGLPVQMQGIHLDISEEVRIKKALEDNAKELAKAIKALEASNEELQQFAYIASHDLQSPLRGISGFASFLKEDYYEQLGDEGREYVDHIVGGCQTMRHLINDLLAFARVDAATDRIKPVDLNDVVERVTKLQVSGSNERVVEVKSDQLPTLPADESQMTQLLDNLIGNGLKYCRADHPVVEVFAEEQSDCWQIGVRDNGIGIASENLKKIFDIFSRLHNQREFAGTGIGLAICRKIVERHGGKIWVESEPGVGSTFLFTIAKEQDETAVSVTPTMVTTET